MSPAPLILDQRRYRDRVDHIRQAFAIEAEALRSQLTDLAAQSYELPTNCPPWTLAELVVHIGSSMRLPEFDRAEEATVAAADFYRRPERSTTEYRQHNVAAVQNYAARILATTTAAAYFGTALDETLHGLANIADHPVVVPDVGPMLFSEWLRTRLISVAAHGLDVAISLGREPWTTGAALMAMRPVFVSLLGAEPPQTMGEQEFFEISTGRRPAESGPYPLLS